MSVDSSCRLHRDVSRLARPRSQLEPGNARDEQPHPDWAHRLRMADGEDGGAQPHQHERGPRSALPERDHDRERGCEPEETRAPVQRVAERIVLEELVDEPACRGLVGDGELIRLLRDDAPCESEDRVKRRVCDGKRKDQRARDPGRIS